MKMQVLFFKMAVLGGFLLSSICLSAQSSTYKSAEGSPVDPKTLHMQKSAPVMPSEEGAVNVSPTAPEATHPGSSPMDLVKPIEKKVEPVKPSANSTMAVREAWVKEHPEDRSLIAGDAHGKVSATAPNKAADKEQHGMNAVQLAEKNPIKVMAIDLLGMDPAEQDRILSQGSKVEVTRSTIDKEALKGMPVTSRLFVEKHSALFEIK